MKLPELERRAKIYAARKSIEVDFDEPVGDGTDGNVWFTNRNSAIKVLNAEDNYLRERNCYQRLIKHGVEKIDGLAVPRLVDFDDELFVVEMEVVEPPYLLDFGKAYLDDSSPFPQEELAAYFASLGNFFRVADLPRVRRVCGILRRYGIEYLDAKPQNIRLRSDQDERMTPDDDWDKDVPEPPVDPDDI
jgi:hypothetical protein